MKKIAKNITYKKVRNSTICILQNEWRFIKNYKSEKITKKCKLRKRPKMAKMAKTPLSKSTQLYAERHQLYIESTRL
jgi:hypothetical protein